MKNLDIILNLLSYEGAATNDPADDIKVKNKIQETEVASVVRYQIQVADAVVDQVIALPANPCLYTAILCDQEISIKVNGAAALVLKPRAAGKRTWVYYTRGTVTSLSVSNASGTIVNLDAILANK